MSYGTYTTTYTVVDIRKAFEGFEADLRMIARRTEKWTNEYVDKIFHDVIKLAEAKYLSRVSISLKDRSDLAIKATRFAVNEAGTSISGERAGGNDWANIPNTSLSVTVEYTSAWYALTTEKQLAFQNANSFKIGWVASDTDTNFPHLRRETAQTYASNGYEITKDNFKQ
jgi:hypothetical protein